MRGKVNRHKILPRIGKLLTDWLLDELQPSFEFIRRSVENKISSAILSKATGLDHAWWWLRD